MACIQSASESIEYVRYKKILPTLRLIKCCSPNTKYLARSRWHTLMEWLKIEANVISQNEIAFYVLYICSIYICMCYLYRSVTSPVLLQHCRKTEGAIEKCYGIWMRYISRHFPILSRIWKYLRESKHRGNAVKRCNLFEIRKYRGTIYCEKYENSLKRFIALLQF